MITHVQLHKLRRVNVARCVKWHSGGVNDWSPSDWACAVSGELGELVEAFVMLRGTRSDTALAELGEEAADVLTYLDLLAERLGMSFIGGKRGIDAAEMTMPLALEQVQLNIGKLCDVIKKLNRYRDGLIGNKDDKQTLMLMARSMIEGAALGLASLTDAAGLDLWEETVSKFDKVSKRNGFDIFLAADEVAA